MTAPGASHASTTRSPRGARRVSPPALALLAAVAAAPAPAAAEPAAGPLPWRVGGRTGFTVDAASFPDAAGHLVEVYVRVPPATLASLARVQGSGRLRVHARLKGGFGATSQTVAEEFEIPAADSAPGFGKVVLLRFPARPGTQRLEVKIEDLHAPKRGIAYLGRRVFESAEVAGEFDVPPPRAGRSLSSPEFVWEEDSSVTAGPFAARTGYRVVPNPERLFGLHATDLRVVFSARSAGEPRGWSWRARLRDGEGRIVAERETTAAAAPTLSGRLVVDVRQEPAGAYDLEIAVWQPGVADTLARHARWSVAWRPESWFRNPRVLEDHVHFLLSADAEDRFVVMHPGEQERYLEHFWRERDPSPGTARNEAQEEFHRRVDLANRAYGRGSIPGMFADMGRVFIRYGEPSEVLKQVVPAGDQTLLAVIRDLSLSEDRGLGEVHQKGLGGDMRPYEVWIYEGDIPLPPDSDPGVERSRRRRLVFLFVDDQGTGDFRLRYSTE